MLLAATALPRITWLEVTVHFVRADGYFFFTLIQKAASARTNVQNSNSPEYVTYICFTPFLGIGGKKSRPPYALESGGGKPP